MNGAEEMTTLVPIPRHCLWLLFPRSTQKVYMQLLSFYMNTRCNVPCSDSAAQYLPALVIILMMGKLRSYPNSSAFCPHPQLQKSPYLSPCPLVMQYILYAACCKKT